MKLTRIEDPRTPLERARKTELENYLRNAGVMVRDLSAEAMREIMMSKGFNILKPIKVTTINNTMEREDLTKLNRFELMRLAKSKNIPVSRSDTIKTLLEKLNG